MKIKLTLIGKREWEKINESTGEEIHCFFYQGFDEKNKPMEFKSNDGTYEVFETLKYMPEKAQEYDLKGVYDSFKGKMKFVEIENK